MTPFTDLRIDELTDFLDGLNMARATHELQFVNPSIRQFVDIV
jgi:hypothetical protein